MTLDIALAAPGQMGSSLAARLAENGVAVATLLEGRSPATLERARAAGMTGVTLPEFVTREIILSVVPPDEALPLVERVAAAARSAGRKPLYVDCNAVSPKTVERIAEIAETAGMDFADGSLIGLPARLGHPGPALFVSGPHAPRLAPLAEAGLDLRILDGPVGAASALKMCYGGITKGLIALGSIMILAAQRSGATQALRDELARSQAQLFAGFSRSIPDMVPKAGRWVPEMEEIAGFLGEGRPESAAYADLAAFYTRLAGPGSAAEIDILRGFFEQPPGGRA